MIRGCHDSESGVVTIDHHHDAGAKYCAILSLTVSTLVLAPKIAAIQRETNLIEIRTWSSQLVRLVGGQLGLNGIDRLSASHERFQVRNPHPNFIFQTA